MTDDPPRGSLAQNLLEEPDEVFHIAMVLPSGNSLIGTIGPIVNGVAMCNLGFSAEDVSEEDLESARQALDHLMGTPPLAIEVTRNDEEKAESHAKMRRMMGGGMG